MKVTHRESSFTLTARSVRMTGILAVLASRSTVSQPLSTTGENAITSTFCAMKERIALIWFSCFCCASENLRSMPCCLAADLIDSVLAVRHSRFGADLAEAEHDLLLSECPERPAGSPAHRCEARDHDSSLSFHGVSSAGKRLPAAFGRAT